jgi:immune inhibitor A
MDRSFFPTFLIAIIFVLNLTLCVPPQLSAASAPPGLDAMESEEVAPAPIKLPAVAIGAVRPVRQHLVRPREEVVVNWLRKNGSIPQDAAPEQVGAAVAAFYKRFVKQTSAWVTPEAQERALKRKTEPELLTLAPAAIQPVTATIFALAVDFAGKDTFTYSAHVGKKCKDKTLTAKGPRKGNIPKPGPRDNYTLWYEPSLTANPKFFKKIVFGYEGAGRVRLDLTDPDDGKPGINLAGYTVQDYYDHVAGKGNVTLKGTVTGWVTVDHSEGYYGAPRCSTGSNDGGGPVPVAQLVVDAVDKFNQAHPTYYKETGPNAFWPKYDDNHDGVIDTFWIIHAGRGQESGGGAEGDLAIWAHSSDLRNYSKWPKGYKVYEGDPSTKDDDIVVGPYTMQPENLDVGVLCEEFGHNFFDLPDMYTTDVGNSIGFWNIMAGGAWAGWLGGSVPAGMPLWFRMIAQCGDKPCNWDKPMVTKAHDAPRSEITIGQLEDTPSNTNKGVRINLPDFVETIPNRAAKDKGAYTDTGRINSDITLDRRITVKASAKGVLSFDSYWDIEEDWDYGYVMVKKGNTWVFLDDMDGVLRETNPNGQNLGHGLTGVSYGIKKLRFDLSSYKGNTITLRLRYKTDAAVTNPGWWLDSLHLDGTLIDDFKTATLPSTFPGWTNSTHGWVVVPTTKSYTNYYLLEWRSKTKYDRMVETCAVYTFYDEDESRVERVPYNIPGTLLYYRNHKYGSTYSMIQNHYDPPSIGPKYQLLVVDMNNTKMPIGDTGWTFNTSVASYDAALTLQPSKEFTISKVAGVRGKGPYTYPSKPAVKEFNDSKGYYAGLYAGLPCTGWMCWNNFAGSAVIPAKDFYSTRITHSDGTPYSELYGWTRADGHSYGSGNPGDEDMQHGLRIRLLSKTSDNKKVKLVINP